MRYEKASSSRFLRETFIASFLKASFLGVSFFMHILFIGLG